ncbi:MAG: sterol desaturase family protein, partial [Pseudomonadales bacterium]|nr:sterol desaturase family protein [Pseudomonadales bacterium]
SHVAHHQSEEYNLSTALRQTGTDYIGFVFYLPLYLVGMPVYVIVTVGSLNLIYQFWVHTRHIRRLGPLEWLLVTPSNHRVHHARNPEYIDKNYGGVFIIWDRMFGTFKDEDETIPCVFGITHQLRSWNPVWANLHVWVETAKLSWRTRSVADKFRVWFKGPGWYPADIAPPTISGDFVPFNPVVSPVNRWSSFIQFWVLTAAALALLNWQNDFPRDFVLVAFVWLTGSFVIQGYFLEGHPLALALETGRILLLVVMLCFYGLIPVQPVILPVALTAPYLLLSLLLLGLQWRGERLVTIPAEDQLPQS